jgi:hypothetical protein
VDAQLEELKRLCAAATPGIWKYHKEDNFVHADTQNYRMIGIPSSKDVSKDQRDANGAYVAAANPATVSDLITRLEKALVDAERYRDIRENMPYWLDDEVCKKLNYKMSALDAAVDSTIDAARVQGKPE